MWLSIGASHPCTARHRDCFCSCTEKAVANGWRRRLLYLCCWTDGDPRQFCKGYVRSHSADLFVPYSGSLEGERAGEDPIPALLGVPGPNASTQLIIFMVHAVVMLSCFRVCALLQAARLHFVRLFTCEQMNEVLLFGFALCVQVDAILCNEVL
uniref:Small ribosomal subunit protein uS5 n=1 Tax=Parascaris univalens TaxID=6257 RepID=A0A915BFV6_PARUN